MHSDTADDIATDSTDMPNTILVVDDEPAHRDSLRRIFERAGHHVLVAEDGEQALKTLRTERVHVVLTDLVMPRMDGMTLLKATQTVQPESDVVVMTAYGTVENAVEAMRAGAYDFITKPVKRAEVLACVSRVLEKQALLVENQALKAELLVARGPDGLNGHSAAIRELMGTLKQVGPSSATVLLQGEPGTGKERCARALHQLSGVADGPFVAVNCAALPDHVLQAEVFGRGAAEGEGEKVGRLEKADGGTLFLDEVGALEQAAQIKLLRFLQEGVVERTGGDEVDAKVRLIVASPDDLKQHVDAGAFREDLYYRLNVIQVNVPPLRNRVEDIPVLAEQFLRRFAEHHNKEVTHLERPALDALCAFHFPGNVRELESALERAVVLTQDSSVHLTDLPADIQAAANAPQAEAGRISFQVGTRMDQLEAAAIDATMRHTGGDKTLTAKLLGISLRTLYRRLEEREERAVADES